MSFEDIRENFQLLDEWEDRYRYLIELGRALEPLENELKTDATKVRGCASQVWMVSQAVANPNTRETTLQIRGESDAHIVQGLIAVLLAIHNNQTPKALLATDTDALFAELGLREHLTPQRSNGLASMIARLRADAERLQKTD
ncbi:MAG: SufE family protein [Pseudomonadota bacterium]